MPNPDVYDRAMTRLDVWDKIRETPTAMSNLLRALLVERKLTTRVATGKEYVEANDAIVAALADFAGGDR